MGRRRSSHQLWRGSFKQLHLVIQKRVHRGSPPVTRACLAPLLCTSMPVRWTAVKYYHDKGNATHHHFTAFVSFIAAFFLIRYKLKEANKEELQAEGILPAPTKHSQPGSIILDMAAKHITGSPTDPRPGPIKLHPSQTSSQDRPVWSTNPHLVQMGPFRSQPPIQLLSRLHSFCILMAALGFMLTMAGIVCYTWAMQPRSVSIFTTACVFVSLGGGGLSLLRENDEHTMYA